MRYPLIAGIIAALLAGALQGQEPVEAKILDVFDSHVTVQVSGTPVFKTGDRVDLTYRAGTLEMLIGTFEVIQIKESAFLARIVSSSMPALKGMSVRVEPSSSTPVSDKSGSEKAVEPGAQEDPKEKKSIIPSFPQPLPTEGQTPAKPPAGEKDTIQGKVTEVVFGDDVHVAYTSERMPRFGATVEIYAQEGGLSRLVGVWEVIGLAPGGLLAKKVAAEEKPAAGMEARFLATEPKSEALFKNPNFLTHAEIKSILLASPQVSRDKLEKEYREKREAAGKSLFLGVITSKNKDFLSRVYAATPMGLWVNAVYPGSPAEKAGIEVADIILKVDGVAVNENEKLQEIVRQSKGKALDFEIERDAKLLNIKAKPETIGR